MPGYTHACASSKVVLPGKGLIVNFDTRSFFLRPEIYITPEKYCDAGNRNCSLNPRAVGCAQGTRSLAYMPDWLVPRLVKLAVGAADFQITFPRVGLWVPVRALALALMTCQRCLQ